MTDALTRRADREAIARDIKRAVQLIEAAFADGAISARAPYASIIGHLEGALKALALGVLHPSREVISDRDHLQTAWDALLREIETLQRATNYDPHPDDEINVSLTVAQAHALEEVADAALSARAVSHPSREEEHDIRSDSEGLHAETAGSASVASGDVPRPRDVRSPEKRCFTYCGDDRCDCGLADPFAVPPFSQADGDERNRHLSAHPPLSAIAEAERALEHGHSLLIARLPIEDLDKAEVRQVTGDMVKALAALRAIPAMTGAADPTQPQADDPS